LAQLQWGTSEARRDIPGPGPPRELGRGDRGYEQGQGGRQIPRRRRGFLKIHLAVDVKTKQIVAMEVTRASGGTPGSGSLSRLGRTSSGGLRVKGLEQVVIHVALSLTVMLAVALTAARLRQLELMRSIKHFTA